jgi:hypothetical protein
MLTFDEHKSMAKGDKFSQQRRMLGDDKHICPATALFHRVTNLTSRQKGRSPHPAGIDAPLYSYHVPASRTKKAGWAEVHADHLTDALRLAAELCYDETGIPAKLINVRSLRAGGATALLCAGVSKDIVKLLGRWRSDAVEVYLRTSTYTLTAGYSDRMFQYGQYKFAPDQVDSSLPHLVPDNAGSEYHAEYIQQLIIYNDDPNKFDEEPSASTTTAPA